MVKKLKLPAAPAGFRNQDRLSANEESQLREGATLDRNLRKKVHPAPATLYRQLPRNPELIYIDQKRQADKGDDQ
jgi:hypothetical protein